MIRAKDSGFRVWRFLGLVELSRVYGLVCVSVQRFCGGAVGAPQSGGLVFSSDRGAEILASAFRHITMH